MKKEDKDFVDLVSKYISENPMNEGMSLNEAEEHKSIKDHINKLKELNKSFRDKHPLVHTAAKAALIAGTIVSAEELYKKKYPTKPEWK